MRKRAPGCLGFFWGMKNYDPWIPSLNNQDSSWKVSGKGFLLERQLERTPRPFPVLKINPEASGWFFFLVENLVFLVSLKTCFFCFCSCFDTYIFQKKTNVTGRCMLVYDYVYVYIIYIHMITYL